MLKRILPVLVLSIVLSSCWYRPNIMFKNKKDFEFSTFKDTVVDYEYRIKPNDYLDFRLYTNDGFKLVDLTSLNDNINVANPQSFINYLVEFDGQIKLPLIDRVHVEGMTIKELQADLEARYSKYYIEPFVLTRVLNRRVTVFSGDGGKGTVINLENNNTSLIEGLALAGGIGLSGKAKKIKLIRGNPENPQVYHIDLSTIEGIDQAGIILQANDIIYVEPRISLSREFTADFAPLISLITSTIALILVLNSSK